MSIFSGKAKRFAQNKPATPPSMTRQPYAMATGEDGTAEIELYGDIVRRRPTDWWTGEEIEGSFIILSEFMADLKKIETAPKIRIRIHSVGGNAYDAMTIHNRLKELSGKGTEIEIIVDGVAMSGGSLIMSAGKTVKVFPGSLIMIHCCWSFLFGGYNAKEMRREAESNEAVDRSQAAIYHAKTGLSQEELLAMMEQETYMTGEEAIEKGFADELIEGTSLEIAASADRRTLFVGGMPVWVSSRETGIPPHVKIPVFQNAMPDAGMASEINNNQPAASGGNEGGKPMAQTLEELRKENPELAEQLVAEAQAAASSEVGKVSDAVEAERKRIADIDAVAALYDSETVQEAKYGDNPCTAQEMTYRAAQKMAKDGKKFLVDLEEDASASGAKDVGAAPGKEDGVGDTPDKVKAEAKRAAKMYKDAKGGKTDE